MDLGGSELGSTGGRRRYAAQGAEEEGGEAEGRWGLGGPLGGAALAASWGAPGASLVGDWGLWVAAGTGEWGGREGMNETLEGSGGEPAALEAERPRGWVGGAGAQGLGATGRWGLLRLAAGAGSRGG